MKLVIGGAFQGKLAFAQTTYGITDGWIDGRSCELMEIVDCCGIHHFHEYIRRNLETESCDFLELERHAENFADWIYQNNPDLILVSNELGYGIVPMEMQERLWREAVGRVCTSLASRADEVVRVVCGVGIYLKSKELKL